jgi:hypothetical protein
MFVDEWPVATTLLILTLPGTAAADPERPSPEKVAKLIAQLGDDRFQARNEASEALEKIGSAALPALRKALAGNVELEVRRRIEGLVARIESNALRAEEKLWQELDAPRRALKDQLRKILARTPAPSARQAATAAYLLAAGRPPTADELQQAEKRLAADCPAVPALALARSLVQGKEYCAAVADASARLAKFKKELDKIADGVAPKLHLLNSDEAQKLTTHLGNSLAKLVPADGPLTDLAFLLVVARFPKGEDAKKALAHLQKAGRPERAADVFWSLINTREFMRGE